MAVLKKRFMAAGNGPGGRKLFLFLSPCHGGTRSGSGGDPERKKDYVEAVLRVEQRIPLRIEPFCHLSRMRWLPIPALPYPEQLKLKEAILKDTFP
jgi:hypothetical protein